MSTGSCQQPAPPADASSSRQPFIPPQPLGAGATIEQLRQKEWEHAVRPRREAAGVSPRPANVDEAHDLVGLALSGGGIRSAVYNLGFLQALSQRGLLRHVDYLCSVSGGGYISGHLASLAANLSEQPLAERAERSAAAAPGQAPDLSQPSGFYDVRVDKNSRAMLADLGVDARGKLLPDYRFRHVGEYLFYDPVQFVWRYLVCTVPMLLLALSALGVLATVVALVWRSLDYHWVRNLIDWSGITDFGATVGLGGELVIAFLPCLVPLTLLLVGAFLYWLGWWREASRWKQFGNWLAKWMVGLSVFCIGCSLAVFLGNGESDITAGMASIKLQSFTWPLLAVTLLFLAPMVRFQSVVNSAREGAPAWQAIAARLVVGGACFCTPFFLVHWMARENISGWVTHRNPALEGEDITQVADYAHWVGELEKESGLDNRLQEEVDQRVTLAQKHKDWRQDEWKPAEKAEWQAALKSQKKPDITNPDQPIEKTAEELAAEQASAAKADEAKAAERTATEKRRERMLHLAATVSEHENLHLGLLLHDRHFNLFDFEKSLSGEEGTLPRRLWHWLEYPFRGKHSAIGEYLDMEDRLRQSKQAEAAAFNSKYLNSAFLTYLLHRELYDAAVKEAFGAPRTGTDSFTEISSTAANQEITNKEIHDYLDPRVARLTPVEQKRFQDFWDRARGDESDEQANLGKLSYKGWTPIEIEQFNRLLMEVIHPEFIRQRAMVSTLIVPAHDQAERLRWLGWWSAVLALTLLVNFNRTSPFFSYYRDRLHQRFLRIQKLEAAPAVAETGDDGECDPARSYDPEDHCSHLLRKLTPWKVGAPYPLFLGSLHLFDRVSPKGNAQGRDAVDADRCLPFVFSPLYCGSVYTGFRRTDAYCGGTLSVADAVAISGAAVTPFMTHNHGLLAMMAAFNLRIGKWLPRPDRARICTQEPCAQPLVVAREWIRAQFTGTYRTGWKYGLAADGGFHEFFGLEELLLRRCRLIIVSDAGCNNGKFEFGALADTIRLVRERHGIEFLDLDHDQPVDLHRLRRHPDAPGHESESARQDQHHICMRVRYPDDFPVPGPREALVVYGQMSLTGDEPLDLQQFRQVNPNFPDEPTTNQSYDETQVESFRQLGYHVADKICQRAPLCARQPSAGAELPSAVETWMDWLRWGYSAECAHSAPLKQNRLRQVDPRAEGQEFDSQHQLPWKTLLPAARDGFQEYLADPQEREQSLLRVAKLLGDAPLYSGPRLTADELVKMVLACQDLRCDFHCAERRDLFEVGGRRRLIRAAAIAAWQTEHTEPDERGMVGRGCDIAAEFHRNLCRGIFKAGNPRTAALATLCFLKLTMLERDRIPEWRNALDCVVPLVDVTKKGKIWKAEKLIRSWYAEPGVTPGGDALVDTV